MSEEPLSLVFEFARTDTPEDAYAFRYRPQDYTLRTTHGGRKRVHLDWSEEFLGQLDALHAPYCDPSTAQRVGRTLGTFLEPSGWTWHAQTIAHACQQSRPVLLTIRSAAAELYALPWELLPLEASGQCIGELPGALVRYEWPETHTVPAKHLSEERAGRVLGAWTAAGGEVPAAEHIDALRAAFSAAGREFDSDSDVVAHASVGKLADAFEQAQTEGRPFTVLHLLCHGGRAGRTWGLVFNGEDDEDEPVAVDTWRLRQLLAPHAGTLRLVVISACGSAYGREFDSVAQALHRAGIQAVVASRFPLSISGSVRVAQTLYEAMLVEQQPLEEAFLRTRRALARDATRLDWAGLQLYARQQDGHRTKPLQLGHMDGERNRRAASEDPRPALSDLDLSSLMELQNQVRSAIATRFETKLALMCVELVDVDFRAGPSEAGVQKRCYELLAEVAAPMQGRIFATLGDSLRVCFPNVKSLLRAVFDFVDALTEHNYAAPREDQLVVGIGLHYGSALSNDRIVVGPAVDTAARVAAMAGDSEILLTHDTLVHFPRVTQAICRPVTQPTHRSEDAEDLSLYSLPWSNEQRLPATIIVEETGEVIPLPRQDIISVGRLDALADGSKANDVVLTHPNERAQRLISRWHFELRRTKDGYVLRALSNQLTEVDGLAVECGNEVPIGPGTTVCLAYVMTLRFHEYERAQSVRGEDTLMRPENAQTGEIQTLHTRTQTHTRTLTPIGAESGPHRQTEVDAATPPVVLDPDTAVDLPTGNTRQVRRAEASNPKKGV
ncbi:CHAT domain-containing protein [Haliangium ochraceum]|uniref:FHA domain containing protein n=1 Tax=Haliangium ochraceum (strain DSM 14365 / JCM 11303 / SMP-2) TaxID=502025 RepID=D0LXR9_HALO1|nr:CHAT domain-containing protein [Haliangium ochraceum]ACY14274.1 FHA domain containing protein [Haliangium ochraceum DSM 14365]